MDEELGVYELDGGCVRLFTTRLSAMAQRTQVTIVHHKTLCHGTVNTGRHRKHKTEIILTVSHDYDKIDILVMSRPHAVVLTYLQSDHNCSTQCVLTM